jgi:hypothetical protein
MRVISMNQKLIDSIEALANEDYACQSGWQTNIYLNPENETVYTFLTCNSVPASAYHNIDQFICKVWNEAIPESVRDGVMSVIDRLQAILDDYQGSEWNGSNHVGRWKIRGTEDDQESYEPISQDISIGYYYDPCDWFVDQDEMIKTFCAGKTAQQYCDDSNLDNGTEGAVKPGEALSWLEARWEEMQAEADDDTPQDPADIPNEDPHWSENK